MYKNLKEHVLEVDNGGETIGLYLKGKHDENSARRAFAEYAKENWGDEDDEAIEQSPIKHDYWGVTPCSYLCNGLDFMFHRRQGQGPGAFQVTHIELMGPWLPDPKVN